ncbi:hypothetical protein M0Q50_02185 [bacterium]|jgi:hypothetical protein|nr:hypothetical protein [bacterium]
MENETWKDIFCNQIDTGSFWKELLRNEFDNRQFLDRSDSVYICKKAQSDAYENIIKLLDGRVDKSIIEDIENVLKEHWKSDDSALGMFHNDKQIK